MIRKRLVKTVEKRGKKRGRKSVIEMGIELSMMETALRMSNGLITKAAKTLGVPISTLQQYIRKHTSLRDALFETRNEIVDEAEKSLMELVTAKNLTAVIFTLKCLGQKRGYIDTPQKDANRSAPIIINLMPASSDVRLPMAQINKGNKKSVVRSQGNVLSLPLPNSKEEQDAIEIESEEV